VKKVTALLVLLIGLLQYKLWFGDGNVLEFQRLNDRIAELRQEGAKRRERNAALEAEVMDLKQGLDAVEERARQDMDMIKDGEVFVQVIDPHQDEPPALIKGKSALLPAKPEAAKTSKPHEAAKPKPASAKSAKHQAPKAAPKKPAAKPKAPAEPSQAVPERQPEEQLEERPPNDEPD
jgi:cell division protein FtsB